MAAASDEDRYVETFTCIIFYYSWCYLMCFLSSSIFYKWIYSIYYIYSCISIYAFSWCFYSKWETYSKWFITEATIVIVHNDRFIRKARSGNSFLAHFNMDFYGDWNMRAFKCKLESFNMALVSYLFRN